MYKFLSDSSVNYGIAGVVVGHEIGHGFDDSGILFSKYGKETILSKKILKSYYQRAECFLDQFDVYYSETRTPPKPTPSEYDYLVCRFFILLDQKCMTRKFPKKVWINQNFSISRCKKNWKFSIIFRNNNAKYLSKNR